MPNIIRVFVCLCTLLSQQLFADELKKVTLQPSWFEQFQSAGYYIAQEKGFYNDVGLDVTIKDYQFGSDAVQKINDGEIDFAVGYESIILGKANHKKIVILYALFQSSPLVLLSTKASKINSISQFVGKKIMTTNNDFAQASLKAMLNSNYVDLENVNLLPHSHNINDLVNKKTDLISAYISKAPYELDKMGVTYNIFDPKDYGFDMYSDFLYTSEALIAKDITTVKAFKAASLKGWQYAFTHITETADLIFAKYNEQNLTKEELVFEGKKLKKLAFFNTDQIGEIDNNKLKRILELYKVLGVTKGNVDFTQLVFDEKNPRLILTAEERTYLNQKKQITMCIDPNWLPYEGFDQQGKHIGLNREFIDIFRKQLPIPIEIVQTSSWSESLQFAEERKCDLLSLAAKTEERTKYLNFTSPYLVTPRVLVTKTHIPFIDNFTNLSNKKIGVPKGYEQEEIIRQDYPNIIIVEVNTIKDGLEKVENGELYGLIGGLDTVGHLLQGRFIGQLKVSGKLDEKMEVGIGVRNDDLLLLQVSEKLVNNLSEEIKQSIINNSSAIKYKEEFNYKLLWRVLFVVLLLIAFFSYRQWLLTKLNKTLNKKINQKTAALQELNESLERRIKERTQKIEHSKMLLQDVAFKDNLTSIFNRHYLFEISPMLLTVSEETQTPLSLLLIDVDHFKKINDTYGHLTGDNILKFIVKNIQAILRADDIFVRFGGEEFIILLPKANLEESVMVAEKLRLSVEQNNYHKNGMDISITVSIGASQYQHTETLEKLISRADLALYSAKEKGRNQVKKN
ncbi:diguanylate cyclase [Psychromonas ingrahamii 37]|uniref:diguanylate cyclase n=1 Tax=Psychromonas ingrahamii (strain DSM 17664 / CCUG 51855 / 37) TaxID=357804 RepID=A1SY47_PSYIN|nr:diguanylate cyclase [Psychromonas ingrahamii]ABM04412.1 diguanylate cyclase [Psychromonas ingrahamii 37]